MLPPRTAHRWSARTFSALALTANRELLITFDMPILAFEATIMTVPPSSEIIFELCLCLIANLVCVGVRGVANPCESYLEPGRHLRV